MARYLDTGSGDASLCLGTWFGENLVPGVTKFCCQFGYYGYRALYPFEEVIREIAAAGRPVHMVFGSNKASLRDAHLRWTFDLINGAQNASLTVMVFSNAEYHPKTAFLERADGSLAAIVGSGNLTEGGMGLNVEAAISLDTNEDDDQSVIEQVSAAAERWSSVDGDGIFHIRKHADIDALRDAKIIDVSQPDPIRPGKQAGVGDTSGPKIGVRKPLWIPTRRPAVTRPPKPILPAKTPAKKAEKEPEKKPQPAPQPATYSYPTRWSKELKSSDAQWVQAGTNPTGKLRLSQAKYPIDQRRYFRYQLFGNENWTGETKNGKTYDIAEIEFDVTIRGKNEGKMTLVVDHAPHREADQNNVPTVLAWGPINRVLTGKSHIGDWVLIERSTSGTFKLTIQQAKPTWAP
jgi:hypothetical protein